MRQAHVVSDDERITRACWRALAFAGYQVQIASVAVGISDDMNAAHPDVVVVDAASDTTVAHEVVQLLRALRSGSVMLAVVRDDDAALVGLLRQQGIDACIQLGEDAAGLSERTTQALQQVLMRNETMALRPAELVGPIPARIREIPVPHSLERSTRPDGSMAANSGSQRLPAALPWATRDNATGAGVAGAAAGSLAPLRHLTSLLQIAVQLVAAPAAAVDSVVCRGLEELTNRLDLNFALCFGTVDGVTGLRPWAGHADRASADSAKVATIARKYEFSGLLRQVGLRHSCFVASLDELPDAAAPSRRALEAGGVCALAVVPLRHGNKLAGFLAVGRGAGAPPWQSVETSSLEMMADLLAGAWVRRAESLGADESAVQRRSSGDFSDSTWRAQLERGSLLPARASGALSRELLQTLSMVEMHGRAIAEIGRGLPANDSTLFTRALERASAIAEQLHAFDDRAPNDVVELHLNDFIVECEPLFQALVAARASVSIVPEASSPRVKLNANGLRRLLSEMILTALDSKQLAGVVIRTEDGERPGAMLLDVRLIDGALGRESATSAPALAAWLDPVRVEFVTDLALAMDVPFSVVHDVDGTTFRASIARERKRRGSTRTSPLPTTSARGATEVMVVEDEPMLRQMVARVLTRLGYSVHSAASAEEAMEYVETHDQSIALLVTDVCLPHRTGPALARAMQERSGGLKLLFMSGYLDGATLATDMGKDVAFLQKPFRQQQLTDRVRELLQDAV